MKLYDCVRDARFDLDSGVAWVAFWKTGRSWNFKGFYPEILPNGRLLFENDDFACLQSILASDESAVLVDNYYCNICDLDHIRSADIVEAIREARLKGWHLLKDADFTSLDLVLSDMFYKYVPRVGKADTDIGEAVRCVHKIVYRFYNDGDTIYSKYTECRSEAKFLEKFSAYIRPTIQALRKARDVARYKELLEGLKQNVVSVVMR